MNAVRAGDGQLIWQTSDLGTGIAGSGRFYSTAAVAFGRVYAGDVDSRVYSFDAKTGEIAWTFSAGDYVYSGVAAADTKGTGPTVYFGSHDRNVYAVDAKSGEQKWAEPSGGQISGPATVVGDVVYVSTFSGNSTIGLDLGTGRRVFSYDDGEYGPVVSDGQTLYLDRRRHGSRVRADRDRRLQVRDEEGPEGDRAAGRAAGGPQGGRKKDGQSGGQAQPSGGQPASAGSTPEGGDERPGPSGLHERTERQMPSGGNSLRSRSSPRWTSTARALRGVEVGAGLPIGVRPRTRRPVASWLPPMAWVSSTSPSGAPAQPVILTSTPASAIACLASAIVWRP